MVGIIPRCILVACLLILITGCLGRQGEVYQNVYIYPNDKLIRASYAMADMLEDNLKYSISQNRPILVASSSPLAGIDPHLLMRIDPLESCSDFGLPLIFSNAYRP